MWKDQIEKKIINQKREVESSPAYAFESLILGVSKKTRKPIKPRKPEKNNRKNQTEKKNRLNRLNFWKNRQVRFRFYKQKTEKTKPNRTETDKKPSQTEPKPSQTGKTEPNRKKPSQTGLNRFFPYKNRTEPNQNRSVWPGFGSVSVFFRKKNISVWLLFLIKTEPNRKWSPLPDSSKKKGLNNCQLLNSVQIALIILNQ